jgi:hypothetical protein
VLVRKFRGPLHHLVIGFGRRIVRTFRDLIAFGT